ncbi:MAG: hypothetical protein IKQ95_03290 [Synergistaceae bacterium]|nr:hypothetical protein [Synergistaceae bacterium]
MQLEYDRNSQTSMEQEISAFSKKQIITQEQAVKEIQQMTDNGILPGYILEKGQYTYNPEINSAYIIRNTSIPSQPSKDARVVTELYASEYNPNIAENAYNYLGEWTSPQGESWVISGRAFFLTHPANIQAW